MILRKLQVLIICTLAFAGTLSVAQAQQRGSANTREATASHGNVIVRFTYWIGTNVKEQEFFYKDGKDYKPLLITQMAFVKAYKYRGEIPMGVYRKATESEIAQRREQGIKGADLEYVEYAKVNIPNGIKDAGILLPGDLKTVKPIVFDFDEKKFPQGATMVMNMSGMPVRGAFAEADNDEGAAKTFNDGKPQSFELKNGDRWVSTRVKDYTILDMRLAVPFSGDASGWRMVFASSAVFHATTRSVIFVLPSSKRQLEGRPPSVEIRQAQVANVPAEDKDTDTSTSSETDSRKKSGGKRTRGEKSSDTPRNPDDPERQTKKRRV